MKIKHTYCKKMKCLVGLPAGSLKWRLDVLRSDGRTCAQSHRIHCVYMFNRRKSKIDNRKTSARRKTLPQNVPMMVDSEYDSIIDTG